MAEGLPKQRQNSYPWKISVQEIYVLLLVLSTSTCWAYQSTPATFLSGRPRSEYARQNIVKMSDGDEGAFFSSFLYEDTFQGIDDGILSYLPDNGKNIPPRARQLIKKITSDYVYGVEKPQNYSVDILDVIDTEYEALSPPVSLIVGNETVKEPRAVQIVSLAVLHQLPKEITLQLASTFNSQHIASFLSAFHDVGWEHVSFPQGLGIRLKRKLRNNPSQSFSPPSKVPWRTTSKRKAALAATHGIAKAAETQAPRQKRMTKDEFLAEIENEMQTSTMSEVNGNGKMDNSKSVRGKLDGFLPSFPVERYGKAWSTVKLISIDPTRTFSNNRAVKRIFSAIDTQYTKMKQAGRAGIMAYAFINFVLYTAGMVWQWRHIHTVKSNEATLCSLIFRKFAKSFARVYAAAAVFKVFRILLAVALAPAAGRALVVTQRKLGVSENTAFAILITLLLKTFLGVLAVVCLGDSALRTTLPLSSPRTTMLLSVA